MSHLLFWPTVTFFYPVGNTSAVCLTENLSPEKKADVLLLACGDPRNILYTVYADETNFSSHLRSFDITCCDVDVAVLARNALLFTFLADGSILDKMDSVWNLFYHMFVDRRALSMLFEQCRKLITLAENPETWRAGPYGHFLTTCDATTLASLRSVWTAYLKTDSFSPKQAKRFEQHFTDGIKDMSRRRGFWGTTTAARSAGPFVLHTHDSVAHQFNNYWSSGTTDNGARGKVRGLSVNPTFAYSIDGDKFAVHYGTDPLSSFHLAEAFASGKFTRLNERIPSPEIVRVAKDQFSRWCTSMSKRLRASNPSSPTFVIRMCAGDVLLFSHALKYCGATQSPVTPYEVAAWQLSTITLDDYYYGRNAISPAPLSFNVIDTSNILDHVGLVNLLAVTAPLLRRTPSATLYTEALLKMGDNHSQAILDHACGDLATMALLLGIVPSTFISQFSTCSNVHEIMTMSEDAKQYHERLAWKAIGLNDSSTPQRLFFSTEDLAAFLFHVYLRMFSDEDAPSRFRLLSLSLTRRIQAVQRSGVLHYNRRSFALFVHHIKTRVHTDWDEAMGLFEALVLADRRLMTGQHAYQELCCQLHLLDVYTAPWISNPSHHIYPNDDVPGLFRDWTRGCIPKIVTLVLVVPRDAIARLEPEFVHVGTPVLHCDMHDGSRQNWFAAISATFGTLRVSGNGEHRVGVITEGGGRSVTADAHAIQPLWRTGAPLIVTFSVLSSLVVDFARNPSATIGLALHPTMAVSATFADKLGFNLTVFRTQLTDTHRVFVLAQRPDVGISRGARVGHWQESGTGVEQNAGGPDGSEKTSIDVRVQMNGTASAVSSFTVRIDVTEPGAQAALRDVRTIPSVSSSTGSQRSLGACLRIGTHVCPVRFPLPVDVTRARLRVARKSSYIEVIAPPASFDVRRPEHDPCGRFASLSPDANDNGAPILGSIHRINLDRCLAFQLPKNAEGGSWCNLHIALMFSDSERACISHAEGTSNLIPDALLQVKRTLLILLRSSAVATLDKTPERVFRLFDTSTQVPYLYIIVARMRLDVGSHTVVADAFVVPSTPAVQEVLGIAPQGVQITTDSDETATWFHLLPRLTERCRTWPHKATCVYRNATQRDGQPRPEKDSLGAWGRQSPLCACGEGVGTEILPKRFERVAPYLTRAAFSPLFSVPYLKEEDVSVCGPATTTGHSECQKSERQCRSCHKEGVLVCSRCKIARYCSATCQRADWKAHKKNCGKGA